jgi:hypothetical protein
MDTWLLIYVLMLHLTTLPAAEAVGLQSRTSVFLMNNELRRTLKEAIVASFQGQLPWNV